MYFARPGGAGGGPLPGEGVNRPTPPVPSYENISVCQIRKRHQFFQKCLLLFFYQEIRSKLIGPILSNANLEMNFKHPIF